MNKQSGKADVKVAAQDEKNSRFSPSNIFFIKIKMKNSFINEASEIPNNIIIGEHGEAEETLNATKSCERTNQITDLKHENVQKRDMSWTTKIVMVQII